MALARVILENAAVMAWLIRGRARERLDTYCLAAAPARNRWLAIAEQYYGDNPESAVRMSAARDADVDTIARELFNDSHTSWAYFPNEKGKLVAVSVKEIFYGANDERPTELFAYDAVYFDTSAYVHSAPASLRALQAALAASPYFDLRRVGSPEELCDRALAIAATAFALVLSVIDEYAGLGIGPAVEEIRNRLESASKSSGGR